MRWFESSHPSHLVTGPPRGERISPISSTFRAHVRDLIRQYRAQEYTTTKWPQNVVAIFDGSDTKGEIFRTYRLYKKMNCDFHALYDVCIGVSFQQFQKYEQGRNRISAARLVAIARILGVTPHDILH